jgi:hypothetical protein
MKLLKSILNDLRSWQKIKLNRWHLHAPIAFVFGWLLYQYLAPTITDTYAVTALMFKIFIPSFLGFFMLLTFEACQAYGRIIGELEQFESEKDLWVSEFFLFLGIILNHLV